MARVVFVFLWVAVFGSLAWVSLPNYEVRERIDSTPLRTIETNNNSKLWFTPSGELAGYGLDGMHITARVWSTSGNLLRERTLELTSPVKAPAPTFAVSNDTSQIAWVSPSGMRVEGLFAEQPGKRGEEAAHPLRRRLPIASLAFIGPNKLASLYEDGELELWDLASDQVTASRTIPITNPGPLISKGAYLATYSLFSHDAFVFDISSGNRIALLENSRYPSEILSVALSSQGRLAVALRESLQERGAAVLAPGAIRAISFHDLSRVMIAGDFPGVFLMGPDSPTLQAAPSDAGVATLAANESVLAFGYGRIIRLFSFKLAETRTYTGFSRPSTWLAIAFLGLISPVAIPLFQGVFKTLWKKLMSMRLAEPETKPAISADDDTMPNFLVDACQNGDCALYAGAGLSAQGELPLWNASVRELVKWAAGDGLIPPDTATAALDELAQGLPGAAADRAASALEGHEDALYLYLRGRYRVAIDLPAAHQLIKQLDFPALVTTTFDNLLDRTFPYSGGRVYAARDCEALERAAARRDFFLLKPFGDLEEPQTIRLGPAQCAEVMQLHPACPDFIEPLFHLRTFLFLGASLEGIERDLSLITLHAPIERKHVAFVAMEDETAKAASKEISDRLRERYGIHIIAYKPSSPSHPELIDFLTRLHAAVRERTSTHKHLTVGGPA